MAADGRPAAALADEAEAIVIERLGAHVWGRGTTTWAEAVADALGARGWTLATTEAGTGGALATLLAGIEGLSLAQVTAGVEAEALDSDAVRVREAAGADVGVAVRILARGDDTAVAVAVSTPHGIHRERRVAFLGGVQGRHRAGLAAADILLRELRRPEARR